MTKQETIQILQSIEDRAVKFPNMTECDWVAIASAKRHLTDSLEVKEVGEPSKDLEEAASRYSFNIPSAIFDNLPPVLQNIWKHEIEGAFIAGAKWKEEQMQKEAIQMMQNAVERSVKVDAGGYPYIDATELYDYDNDKPLAKAGDRVKVVFIKDK